MPDIKSHKRVHDMLLGPLERPTLQWLCAHMPAWANSDFMTVVGIIGSLVTFFSYWLTNIDRNFLWLASLGFVINWVGNSRAFEAICLLLWYIGLIERIPSFDFAGVTAGGLAMGMPVVYLGITAGLVVLAAIGRWR